MVRAGHTVGAVHVHLGHDGELGPPGLCKLLHLCIASWLLAPKLQCSHV